MIDGKMQDDATWKQCKVMVELAEMLAHKDPSSPRRTASSTPWPKGGGCADLGEG